MKQIISTSIVVVLTISFSSSYSFAGNLADNGNGTITHSSSKLMWQQVDGGSKSWKYAITYCDSLSLASHNDWRLPSNEELMSLVDKSFFFPAIDTKYFPERVHGAHNYWTSTEKEGNTRKAHFIHFMKGSLEAAWKTEKNFIRCVRTTK